MIGIRSVVLIGLGAAVLVAGFLLFGAGSRESPGGGYATELVPVDPASRVGRVSLDPSMRGIPKKDLPPVSTLNFRGQTISSAGEILGTWEPESLFARSNEVPAKGRTDEPLGLSDGDILEVPANSELTFVYGGAPSSINFLDVMAFKVAKGDLWRGEDGGVLLLQTPRSGLALPVVLPLLRSEPAGRKRFSTKTLSPGVYVISVAAAVSEGGVRYNFRVLVER